MTEVTGLLFLKKSFSQTKIFLSLQGKGLNNQKLLFTFNQKTD
jgi:hypothetical protein